MKIKGYKFIQDNMKSKNGNHIWKLNKWYKHEGELELCESGFHACLTPRQSLSYAYGNKWFIVEAKGKIIHEENDKFVASEMRLIKEIPIDKVVKRFAIFCARQCLANYENKYPNDKRISNAIKAAENYLDGKIGLEELQAAESAAESAVWSARSAAESAAESAESAAESAAWSARSAAESAAESAAIKEQDRYLLYLINQEVEHGKKK